MSRGRRVPPPIIFAPVRANDPSQDADGAYFRTHPHVRQYTRDLIPGECPEPMPPGTRVVVQRIGAYQRARAFVPPQEGLN